MLSKDNRVAAVFSVIALTLLVGLLLFWLQSVFQSKSFQFQKETNYILDRSFNVVQDSLLNVFIDSRIEEPGSTRSYSFRYESEDELQHEQHIISSPDIVIEGSDTLIGNVHIEINASDTTRIGKSLKMIKAFEPKWSIDRLHDTTLVFLVEKEFEEALSTSGIPAEYKTIVKQFKGKSSSVNALPASFILGKMVPEILFSLVLLGSMLLAFYFVFESLRKQKDLNRLKDDLISNISHELKTPLATVKVALEAIKGFDDSKHNEKRNEYIDISNHQLNRISLLVDKVLSINQFQTNSNKLDFREVDLLTLSQETLASFGVVLEQCEGSSQLHVEGSNFQVKGDELHLTNIIYNLIDNAIKYSEGKPKIELFLVETESQLKLAVKDYGRGIPNEYHGQIFERFFRIPSKGATHNTKGHGLGLSYTAELVKQHGGTIAVQNNEEGQGCTFTVTFNRQ